MEPGVLWDHLIKVSYFLYVKMIYFLNILQAKKLGNQTGNNWNATNAMVTISENGLKVSSNMEKWLNVFSEKAFPIAGENSRIDHFPGTILYYFEIIKMSTSKKSVFKFFR